MTRQTMSFTRKADNRPQIRMTVGSRWCGWSRRTIDSATRSEEPSESQIGHHHHHGEQQDDRREVDRPQGVVGGDDAEGDHQDGADDGGAGPIDFIPGNLPSAKTK